MPEAERPPMRFFECRTCDDIFECMFSNDYTDPAKWYCPYGLWYSCPPFLFGLWPNQGTMAPAVIYCDPENAQIDLGNPRHDEEFKEMNKTEDIPWDKLKRPIKGYPFPF